MKRILRNAMAAIAVITLFACNNLNETAAPALNFEKELVFTASREGVSPDTKTVRMEDGSTWWNASEEISVFYGSGSAGGSKFTSMNTTLHEIVEFSGSVTMSGSGKDFWAVYPYSADNSCDGTSITTIIPDMQIGSEGNFSGDVFPAMAKSKTLDLAFWNICGGIKFFVSRSDIKSVTFKGNNDEILAGKVKVLFNDARRPVVSEVIDGRTEVTLTAPDGGTFKAGKYYYLTLLPMALNGGFTMSFNTATEKGDVVSKNVQTVKRSIFGVLKNVDSKVTEWKKAMVDPEAVDLGLPSGLKWATFNVGATKPEEYGEYFAWGETQPKDNYSWSTYKWCNGDYNKLTKYCNDSSSWDSSDPMDNKTVLDLEDDAAHVNLGGSWRMPTDAEWTELKENCTWTWTTQNGVNGRLFTSKTNSNSIFLPAAGYLDTFLYDVGSRGYYWSSSLYSDSPHYACYVSFGSVGVYRGTNRRCDGFSVRPVFDDRIHPESVTLNKSSSSLSVGDSEQLTATISPSAATDKRVTWSSDNQSVATVSSTGLVTAVSQGDATITVTTNDCGLTATCKVTIYPALTDVGRVAKAVDLGLSVKWATYNLGATAPEENGDYFAWGETEPKDFYDESTYKWCNGGLDKLTKYCPSDQTGYWDGLGLPDNMNVLDFEEDDAAQASWGGGWRIPTDAEWTELIDNCTWTWTTQNGVNGRLATSKKNGYTDKSIFLPASGGMHDMDLINAGSYGYYWSSSLLTDLPNSAYFVQIYSGGENLDFNIRCDGFSVRPVTE